MDKFGAISKVIVIILIALILCSCAMLFVDSAFNGTVGDWFVEHFIRFSQWEQDGKHYYRETFNWSALKTFLTYFAIGLVILWTGSIILTFVISRRSHAKKVSLNTAKHIRNRLAEEVDGWPSREYGHITPYIDDIRKQISDSKKLVLDEVSKKNDLIAYLAHDLKTPLTSVIGYLSLLKEAPEMPTEQKAKYIHISLRKAQRLETLINEFFDITRYNLHEMLLEKENIDLGYMLNQMVDEFYPLLQSHGNSVSLKIPEDLRIHADPVKLARVFNNILKNAIAYSYADSLIEISANAFSETVRITFTNAGNTIPKLKLDTIFEKFYRMDEARSTNTGGAGLGLAIAKEIVLRHGGTISAQSEDHITSFTVELPTSE